MFKRIKRWLNQKQPPYYKQYPGEDHAVTVTIDDHSFVYAVPGHENGWKSLVDFVNELDDQIEAGEIDTRIRE